MNLTIFESDMGDCLLLEAASGELVLCDGGMKGSMQAHVRDALSALGAAGRALDLVYVSHIDNDHINGVLQLFEDAAEWRVFDLHEQNGDPIREPKVPRPPEIRGVLHNAFRDQVSANTKAIENLLVAAVPSLYATAVPALARAADEMQGIAAGVREALKVSGLVGANALNIPVNQPPGVATPAKLLFAGRPGAEFDLGSMHFTLLGPTKSELTQLRKGWNTWLKENKDVVTKIRAELKKKIEEFSAGVSTGSPYDLRDWNGVPDFKGVSAPNVASLMFLVEENGKQVLLTGDAQQDFILDGLKRTGHLAHQGLHVDVLKVQHHGSLNNLDANFARNVSADHYVFCGNGAHENPEIGVVQHIYDSRLGKIADRALAAAAKDRDFHFWFSTTSQAAPAGLVRRTNFEALEARVAELVAQAGGRLKVHYNQGSAIELSI